VSINPAPSDERDDDGDEGRSSGLMTRARGDWRAVAVFSALVGFGVASTVFLFAGTEGPRPPSGDELQCKDLVRGKIAWNYAGNTDWDANALELLCKGTTRPAQPPLCFDLVFHGRVDWGGGTEWRWRPAAKLCAGTDDARGRVQCFKEAVARGTDFRDAIELCNPSERAEGRTTCHRLVQGSVAWNEEGDRNWTQRKLDLLCGKTSNPTQPLLCFDRLFHGRGTWDRIVKRDWRRAAQLCSGTANVRETMQCVMEGMEKAGPTTPQILDAGEPPQQAAADPDEVFNAVLKSCNPPEATAEDGNIACRRFVQGNIPWSADGNTTWQAAVLDKLCENTTAPQQPGLCFSRAMHGGLDMGEHGLSKWAFAVELCSGTSDADERIDCFQRERSAGKEGQAAISACKRSSDS